MNTKQIPTRDVLIHNVPVSALQLVKLVQYAVQYAAEI